MTINQYDLVPYESFPHSQTSPAHLYTVATFFGMSPSDFKKAKVLELGCASGGNLIPLAVQYPESEFLGIDLSERQIEFAKEHVNNLGLTNIDFKKLSILDVTKDLGLFDYIICHGVYSWVPQHVQDKIIAVCKENLSPTGLAIVSYNTLPGWNVVRSAREMMLYHIASFDNPADKVAQSKALLQFITDSLESQDTPYKALLQQELSILQQQNDSYLLHDHLEEENNPVYFHQFMSKATQVGLQYVGDCHIDTMFAGNFPQKALEVLSTSNDQVRQEQYMDFITNRRFRHTILCHQGIMLNRNLRTNSIDPFYIASLLEPAKPVSAIDFSKDEPTEFRGPMQITSHQRTTTALLCELWLHRGYPLSVEELIDKAMARTGINDANLIRHSLYEFGVRFVLGGALKIYAERPSMTLEISDKPKVLPLARYQAQNINWLTNARHERIAVDTCARLITLYLDGHHDRKTINAKILEHVLKGDLVIKKGDEAISEMEELRMATDGLIDHILENFARNALLVA